METMTELYSIISFFIAGGLFLTCGLLFILMRVPDTTSLANYRKARYMMSAAYLFFIPCIVLEYLLSEAAGNSFAASQMINLVISIFQVPTFTLALLALLDVKFMEWQYIFRKVAPVVVLIIIIFMVYIFVSEKFFQTAFYLFVAMYAIMIMYYAYLFFRGYRRFRFKMDNYFSDNETGRMRWIVFSYIAALVIGTIALFSVLFTSDLITLLFTTIINIFYLFFAIRFTNYAHKFHTIEKAMEMEIELTDEIVQYKTQDLHTSEGETAIINTDVFTILEKRIEQWVADKYFTEKGITLDMLVSKLYTNRSYLSNYINQRKGKTFREWINQLRVEEAKNLLLQYPNKTMTDIAEQVGFSDKAKFRHYFIQITGYSPINWRNMNSR
jgi:AraC-like DNA-binding protein